MILYHTQLTNLVLTNVFLSLFAFLNVSQARPENLYDVETPDGPLWAHFYEFESVRVKQTGC